MLVVNLIINAFTWYPYQDDVTYWLIALFSLILGGGGLFYLLACILFKDRVFKYMLLNILIQIPAYMCDMYYIDQFDYVFKGIKVVLYFLICICIIRYYCLDFNN